MCLKIVGNREEALLNTFFSKRWNEYPSRAENHQRIKPYFATMEFIQTSSNVSNVLKNELILENIVSTVKAPLEFIRNKVSRDVYTSLDNLAL